MSANAELDRAHGDPAGAAERAASLARAAAFLPAFAVMTGAASVAAVALGSLGRTGACDALIRAWARATVGLFNIHVEPSGLEHLPPPGRGAIFLFNHQSHMDVPSIHSVIARTLRFGAKIELFKVPLFGAGMRAVGVLPIARADRAAVFRVYRDAASRLADGWSFILAPEGTRQDEPRIGPFKKGPFLFAIEAQAPLIPIVLKGTIDVLPKGRLAINAGRWSRTVRLRVLAPVETSGLSKKDMTRLMEDVRAKMVDAYESM